MAGKKKPSPNEALDIFKDITDRASLKMFYYNNRQMISKNPKGANIIIIPDIELWNMILESFKDVIREIDMLDVDQSNMAELFKYTSDLSNNWLDLDTNNLYQGDVLKITIDGFNYELSINKGLIPLKLRKAEYNNISYKIFKDEGYLLGLKKRFDYPLEGYLFTIVIIFQII